MEDFNTCGLVLRVLCGYCDEFCIFVIDKQLY